MDEIEEWKRKRMEMLMKAREKKREVTVITSPTCPYCPMALRLAKEMENKGLCKAREVSVATPEGMELARKHRIQGVPTILVDGKVAFVGVPQRHELEEMLKPSGN